MAGPRLLDTEITTKTHNRTEQGRSPALPGKARRTAPEPPCVGMPARLPAAAVVCGGGGGGDHGVPRAVGGGPVAGGVVRGRGAAAVRGGE
jgi:hypothetical protein